ncbi:MAG: UDP-4-amino-4,6-dideoxy-N-acetyl-beta-L-altrosamine transaminase [Truepera sp.]|jgi:UDP-4-amino-4,6-dideoxy-N-acetyl-beta-L-altrosamine transaminase|nr:UDP-4-amino-4,6-dideoxy-N-acetyl-beta-L-altrosamine transaminase [Truepera sp.]
MSSFIPYGRQWVDDDDVAAVSDVMRSDYLTTGPAVDRFESALTGATGASHAVALNSGTSALHAMYFAAGLGPGDEIITTPLTFAATANAALYLGATVRFVDVQEDTGNLDPELIKDAISPRTRLIVPVDFAGHPADYDRIHDVAAEAGVTVVSDAAHSLGATYNGRPVGTLAKATELSFHPVKPITTAEGGAVLTDDADLAARARTFRTHGITREPTDLTTSGEGPWWYEQQFLGFNYRLSDIQAALGYSQMRKLQRFLARRRAIAATYMDAFSDLQELILPTEQAGVESGWHLFVVRVRTTPSRRRPFFERLRELGLGVQVHYIPVYFHPYYQQLGYARGACPVAEDFYSRAISLPIYPQMSDDDVASSVERVRQAVKETLA